MPEIWKDIKGYEGFYQISNSGKVKSIRTGKELKQFENSKGYYRVLLCSTSKSYAFVHRLVAFHFVENSDPENNNVVNHLDSNPKNNVYTNLEWTTMSGNIQHAVKAGRMNRTKEWLDKLHKSQKITYKPVRGYDPISGKVKYTFKNLNESTKHGFQPSCICNCCKGKRKTHKGLKWEYYSGGDE